ncbi:hypothetical protein ZEAMMB73_Zm00001d014151, partial [Zea mays]
MQPRSRGKLLGLPPPFAPISGFVVISVRVLDQKAQMEPMDQRTLLVNQAAAFVAVIYAYFMSRLRVAQAT